MVASISESVEADTLAFSQVWAAIEEVVDRRRLAAAVDTVDELAPVQVDDDAAWRAELVSRWAVVRPFLPLLAEVIPFGATLARRAGRRHRAARADRPQEGPSR